MTTVEDNRKTGEADDDFEYQYGLPDDPAIRMGFIRKVYGILSVQLIVTSIISGLFMYFIKVQAFFEVVHSPFVLIAVIFGYFGSFCALVCCGLDKKVPVNYALLGIFTLCMSFLVGIITIRYNPQTVLEAASMTAAATIGITIYAVKTKTDFTICGPMLFVVGMVFFTLTIFACVFGAKGNLFISAFGVILFSIYLIYDTQMIVGGKNRKYKIDEDSYILAAVVLYLDIINLFIYILQMMGGGD